ncbi:hypothetical protein BMT55_06940 [Listeria newyorkensis]|uniref:LPXTG-motif cell wall anchor domain-containing protein n=2 Tax=Listeria newyorkensis TaxID=1497681 RepID=A0ABX4XNL4_9LIST|nr:immunoglobulin-like domain-containing protein [Listeria newyorkensis]KGL38718.1 hypothetical protein EP58_14885 [Listeria newyorkensis]PNP92691.1 hypothetical protein BMT55_06940 [Listeria newyorkensis]WAO23106.1 DUF5011 domain-containing protein [Listeria newyorkensis]SQC56955.1 C protein alpha-antigen precursor [Listeria newyorkensis]
MKLKKIGVTTVVMLVCTVLPIQPFVSASENLAIYSTRGEDKLKEIQKAVSSATLQSNLTKPLEIPKLAADNETIQLVNGSFENPVIDKTYALLDASLVPGWNTTAVSNLIEIQRNYGGVKAADGDQHAELNSDSVAALYQDVETIPGKTIRWKVSHRGRSGIDTAVVKFGAPDKDLSLITTMSSGNKAWVNYQGTYTIPEGQTVTRFEFEAISTADGNKGSGNFIDDIVFSTPSVLRMSDSVAQASIKKNDTTIYEVSLNNTGGMDAGNVKLEIPLPEQLAYIPDSVSVDGNVTNDVTYDALSHTVSVHLDKVNVNSTSVVSVGVKALTVTNNEVNIKTKVLYEDDGFKDAEYSASSTGTDLMIVTGEFPVIRCSDTTIKKGKLFNSLAGVSSSDLEDGDLTNKIKIVENTVNTAVVGTYYVTYSVTDSDDNTTTKTIAVTVTSNDAPTISATDKTLKKGSMFDPKVGVTATDTEDGNLTPKISVIANDVNTSEVGTYHITYSVTDSDDNTTTKTVTVTVTSNDAPIIEASDVVQHIHKAYNVKKGVTASDTEDGDITNKIIVTSNDVDTEKVGVYHVTYSVTDSDDNTTTKTIQVTILTNDAPVITTNDDYLKVGDIFNPMVGITASDLEDGDLTDNISIISNNVNMESEGQYAVVYSVTDSDNNTTSVTRHVYVRTNDKPEIHVSDQTIKAGLPFDPKAIVSASDLEDGDVTHSIEIVSNDVNTAVTGTYHITYSVTDSDKNTTTRTIKVTVLTNEKPMIIATNRIVKAHFPFDPMLGVSASDLEDGDLSPAVKIIANDVNIDVPGDYHITYSVLDSDGNTTEQTYTVTVLTNEKPVIHANDITLTFGQAFDPMAGMTAEDLEDGDITSQIQVISNDVNPNVAGIYHVTYSVTDSDGNETQFTITVLVGAQPIVPVDPISPVAPAVPTTPAKPSPSVKPAPSASPVVPVKVAQPTKVAPTNALPTTGDSDTTSTVLFGGLLAALGALFLRRKK